MVKSWEEMYTIVYGQVVLLSVPSLLVLSRLMFLTLTSIKRRLGGVI